MRRSSMHDVAHAEARPHPSRHVGSVGDLHRFAEHERDQLRRAAPASLAVPTTLPRRMTVTCSQSSSTSSSLWETKMTLMPSAASSRSVANSRSRWSAEMPVVGSSRMSTRAPSQSRRVISTCWRSPTVSVRAGASRSKPNPKRSRSSVTLAPNVARGRDANEPGLPSRKLSRTDSGRKTQGVLVQHADAGRRRGVR